MVENITLTFMAEVTETKIVKVSPQWKVIFEDLKDLLSDFLWGSAATGLTMLLDYVNALDLSALVGDDNSVYAGLIVGAVSTFIGRVIKKIRKESNYPT